MQIKLDQVSKKYGNEFVLKNMNFALLPGETYGLVGPNGTGKSTLLKLLSGFLSPTKGRIEFSHGGERLLAERVYKQISYTAPYIELIEEFTMLEVLTFHTKTRGWQNTHSIESVMALSELGHAKERELRHFSSGMKQRLKIAIALCTSSSCVLLDEPTTNLDQKAVKWYLKSLQEQLNGRLCVIASNDAIDLEVTTQTIDVMQYK
jgi:ABC-type multidrug transport system ATPase subunit